jgi:hypothetical protein
MVTELIDLEKKSRKMDFEKIKRQIELHLLSPEKGSSQIAIDLASSYILSDNHIKCIRQDDNDEFWIYREGIYLPEGKSYIIEMCDQLFHVAYTPQKSCYFYLGFLKLHCELIQKRLRFYAYLQNEYE